MKWQIFKLPSEYPQTKTPGMSKPKAKKTECIDGLLKEMRNMNRDRKYSNNKK